MNLPVHYDDLPNQRFYWPHPAKSPEEGLGMLNLLTPEVVAAAAQSEIQTGQRTCLNWNMTHLDYPPFGRRPFQHEISWVMKPIAFDDVYHFNPQQSSQWDGFRHHSAPVEAGKHLFYGGTTAEEILDPNNSRIGIGQWARTGIAGRGVLIDYASWAEKRGIDVKALSGHSIPLTAILEIVDECRISFRKGDVLFLRSGWTKTWDSLNEHDRQAYGTNYASCIHTGVEQSEDMLRFLWDHHFAAVASDTFAFEVFPSQHPEWSLHERLLAGWGVPIGEMFDLEELAKLCQSLNRWSFFLSSSPLNCAQGVSSPSNAMAIF